MIPLRLTLKNFMSYREPGGSLDFRPLHTACLTGDNGAGKSALLTAMTWALWGETPAHAGDEDLIAQGATERKDILARILGLEEYDRLAERARERVRDLESERRALMLGIQELDTRIARKAELQQQAAEVAAYLQQARATLADVESAAELIR